MLGSWPEAGAYPGWTGGTGRWVVYLLQGMGVGSPAGPGWPWLGLLLAWLGLPDGLDMGLAPFQSQDPATLIPSSRSARVQIHERGGSA